MAIHHNLPLYGLVVLQFDYPERYLVDTERLHIHGL